MNDSATRRGRPPAVIRLPTSRQPSSRNSLQHSSSGARENLTLSQGSSFASGVTESVYEHSRDPYRGHRGTRLLDSFDIDEQPLVRQRLENDAQQFAEEAADAHEPHPHPFERPRLRQRTNGPISLVQPLIFTFI